MKPPTESLLRIPDPWALDDNDPIEIAARALAEHKDLKWEMMKPSWREEQREQVRLVLKAIRGAA
jgi:hypothetical protein